jgi:hypothetical protein
MEAATVRRAPARVAAPRAKAAPAERAPARRAPARRRPAPSRRPRAQLIPIAVSTASAVGRLPDSGLVVRMTRGRAWIAVLGVLLTGIVALNVITLSFAASAGHIDENIQALDRENSILRSRDAARSATERVRTEAAALGLSASTAAVPGYVEAAPDDVRIAAQRLAASGSGG